MDHAESLLATGVTVDVNRDTAMTGLPILASHTCLNLCGKEEGG